MHNILKGVAQYEMRLLFDHLRLFFLSLTFYLELMPLIMGSWIGKTVLHGKLRVVGII